MTSPTPALLPLVARAVEALPPPPAGLVSEAVAVPASRAEHDRLARTVAAFAAVEVSQPPARPASWPIHVAAWNAERLKHRAASADLVAGTGADVLLLSETDVGMARSSNRHTAADLAEALGMGYAYGLEFLETGLGDARERAWHAGETNRVGFHGNAVLSRLPIEDVLLVRLDDGAVWWCDATGDQRRLGARMAIAARLRVAGGSIVAVVAHLESRSDADYRAAQTRRLIAAVDAFAAGDPVVIGGDFNTAALPPIGPDGPHDWLAAPQRREPLFADLAAAGFDWRGANTAEATQRMLPDGAPTPPFRRIDWLFVRGLSASAPRTVAAVDGAGAAISDHDLVGARLAPA
jgi:endonuclease/exonuclease/phosphatase family metal-dependent hydrolase